MHRLYNLNYVKDNLQDAIKNFENLEKVLKKYNIKDGKNEIDLTAEQIKEINSAVYRLHRNLHNAPKVEFEAGPAKQPKTKYSTVVAVIQK